MSSLGLRLVFIGFAVQLVAGLDGLTNRVGDEDRGESKLPWHCRLPVGRPFDRHLPRILILSKALQRRMPDSSVTGPIRKFHLGHRNRLDPAGFPSVRPTRMTSSAIGTCRTVALGGHVARCEK
jgi:hypothetical protein